MGVLTLLEEARAAGLTLTVTAAGDRLRIKGPRRAIALAKALKAHKAEILALLAPAATEARMTPRPPTTHWAVRWRSLQTGGEGWEDLGPLSRAEADEMALRLNRVYEDKVHHVVVPAPENVRDGGGES
jgi:hypothetical protein